MLTRLKKNSSIIFWNFFIIIAYATDTDRYSEVFFSMKATLDKWYQLRLVVNNYLTKNIPYNMNIPSIEHNIVLLCFFIPMNFHEEFLLPKKIRMRKWSFELHRHTHSFLSLVVQLPWLDRHVHLLPNWPNKFYWWSDHFLFRRINKGIDRNSIPTLSIVWIKHAEIDWIHCLILLFLFIETKFDLGDISNLWPKTIIFMELFSIVMP